MVLHRGVQCYDWAYICPCLGKKNYLQAVAETSHASNISLRRSGFTLRMSPDPKKRHVLFLLLFLTFKQTSIAPSQCSTENDEITYQKRSWWDPTSSRAEPVRDPKPKQPTEEITQVSLTAEGYVVRVDFQTFCALWKMFRYIQ